MKITITIQEGRITHPFEFFIRHFPFELRVPLTKQEVEDLATQSSFVLQDFDMGKKNQ